MEDLTGGFIALVLTLFVGGMMVGYFFKDKYIPDQLVVTSISQSDDGNGFYIQLDEGFSFETSDSYKVGDVLVLTKIKD